MTKTNNVDKFFGIALTLAAATSFIGTTDVSAQPIFPPQPHAEGAEFSESTEKSSVELAAPWYRQNDDRTASTFVTFNTEQGRFEIAFADRAIGPYYRAAN